MEPKIEWVDLERTNGCSWAGMLGEHQVGHVFKLRADIAKSFDADAVWQFRVWGICGQDFPGRGSSWSFVEAKKAVENAIRAWFVEAGLMDEKAR